MTSIRTIALLCISLASAAAMAQTSYNRIGSTTYITTPAARGTTCTQIGSQTYCN